MNKPGYVCHRWIEEKNSKLEAVYRRKSDEKSIAMIAGPMMVRFTLHTAQDGIPELELVRGILEEVKRGQGTQEFAHMEGTSH